MRQDPPGPARAPLGRGAGSIKVRSHPGCQCFLRSITGFGGLTIIILLNLCPSLRADAPFPRPLTDYAHPATSSLSEILRQRIQLEPFNAVATLLFLGAILHTFAAGWFIRQAHRVKARTPGNHSLYARLLHLLGEVEIIFALWVLPLTVAITLWFGPATAARYVNSGVRYDEALFVFVIMCLAATRPVLSFTESILGRIAGNLGNSPLTWWLTVMSLGPILGSFITEPAAMTLSALLLARRIFPLHPSHALAYATVGTLFVNVSIGGTLTHFAAPPILMVARPWNWDTTHLFTHFGWKSLIAIVAANTAIALCFRHEFKRLSSVPSPAKTRPDPSVPAWITAVHLAFLGAAVAAAHHPALVLGCLLLYFAFHHLTEPDQDPVTIRSPMLVAVFLGGLVIHGGLQQWWIEPLLSTMGPGQLLIGGITLTAFNDNAAITFLATLVPDLGNASRQAIVSGAVLGGGLTVIANAPNPAGQAILARFFPNGLSPIGLLIGALPPTLIATLIFVLLPP